jgi:hypothetical protein
LRLSSCAGVSLSDVECVPCGSIRPRPWPGLAPLRRRPPPAACPRGAPPPSRGTAPAHHRPATRSPPPAPLPARLPPPPPPAGTESAAGFKCLLFKPSLKALKAPSSAGGRVMLRWWYVPAGTTEAAWAAVAPPLPPCSGARRRRVRWSCRRGRRSSPACMPRSAPPPARGFNRALTH